MIHLHPYLPRSLVLGFLFWSAAAIPPPRSSAITRHHPTPPLQQTRVFPSAMKGEDGARRDPDDGGDAGGKTDSLFLALQGISSLNCWCTLTVFLSLLGVFGSRNATISYADQECTAGKDVEEDMIYYLNFSFVCFLFNTFLVQCLKLAIMLGGRRREGIHLWGVGPRLEKHGWGPMRVSRALLVVGVGVSLVVLSFGFGFAIMTLVNVTQIRLGRLDCSVLTATLVKFLIILLPIAVLIFVSTVVVSLLKDA